MVDDEKGGNGSRKIPLGSGYYARDRGGHRLRHPGDILFFNHHRNLSQLTHLPPISQACPSANISQDVDLG
jgi:hypothetical protein